MVSAETTVLNKTGLHARPASMFSAEAGKFSAKITVKNLTTDSQEVNAKSIMRVMTLAMGHGDPHPHQRGGAGRGGGAAASVAAGGKPFW